MNFKFNKLSYHKLVRNFSLNTCENQRKNHYDCLGITPKATQGDVKNAYYKLSKQYHPDLNKESAVAAEKFRDIAAAYEVLGNVKARKLYDRGILVGVHVENDSKSDERTGEDYNYKHASFYHHRNKPASTKSNTSKSRHYDMDEWTRAHYSETFSNRKAKETSGQTFVRNHVSSKKENEALAFTAGILATVLGFAMLFEANAKHKFDNPSELSSENKPD